MKPEDFKDEMARFVDPEKLLAPTGQPPEDDDALDGVRSYLTTGVEVELDAYLDKKEARIEALDSLARELVEHMEIYSAGGFEGHPDEKLREIANSPLSLRWQAIQEIERRALLQKAREVLG